MAEISPSSQPGDQKRKRKKLSTRVDLTPMVDLGFLLITFFIFTTTMSEPTAMKLKLPNDTVKDSSQTAESKTLSIVLGNRNAIWSYNGNDLATIEKTTYAAGIRQIIQERKQAVARKYGDSKELVVLIKPEEGASYDNVVNILDEMVISDVARYMLVDPNKEEILQTSE